MHARDDGLMPNIIGRDAAAGLLGVRHVLDGPIRELVSNTEDTWQQCCAYADSMLIRARELDTRGSAFSKITRVEVETRAYFKIT